MIKKYKEFLNEDYYYDPNISRFGNKYVSVDIDDYEEERNKVDFGEKYEINDDIEEYDEEGFSYDSTITRKVTKTKDCDELELRITPESKMDRDHTGTIILNRNFDGVDENDPSYEDCPIETINSFIIYDDGNLAWDNSWEDILYSEVILYIYHFFDMTTETRKVFNEYWKDEIDDIDDEKVSEFEKKYDEEFKAKKIKDFNI